MTITDTDCGLETNEFCNHFGYNGNYGDRACLKKITLKRLKVAYGGPHKAPWITSKFVLRGSGHAIWVQKLGCPKLADLTLWSAEAPTDPKTPKSLKWPKSDFKVTFPTLGKVTP